MNNYNHYEIARAKWLMATKAYQSAAEIFNKTYINRSECWQEVERLAKLLSPEEQERAKKEQFGEQINV